MSEEKDESNLSESTEEIEDNPIIGLFPQHDEKKEFGIPCPENNTVPPIEAKAIVLRCVVCGENQIQTVNFPCMHACFCVICASQSLAHSDRCPQCRANYMHISMLYLCYGDASHEDLPPLKKRK